MYLEVLERIWEEMMNMARNNYKADSVLIFALSWGSIKIKGYDNKLVKQQNSYLLAFVL